MSGPRNELAEVLRRDPRYPPEAYEFLLAALAHAQQMHDRPQPQDPREAGPEHHLTGPELLAGVRDLALREFGLMARVVFRIWGIDQTDDFGEIVFNLIDAQVLSKTDRDSKDDFHQVYDLDRALTEGYDIPVPTKQRKRGEP